MFQKTFIAVLFFCLSSIPFYAQEVTWGEKIENTEEERVIFYHNRFLKKDSEGIHFYSYAKKDNSKYIILDDNLNLVSSKDAESSVRNYSEFGNKLYKADYTSKRKNYLGSGITSIGMTFYGQDYKKIESQKLFTSDYKERWMPRLEETSPDKTKLLVSYDNERNIKSSSSLTVRMNGDPLTYAFAAFDENGKLILKKEIKSEVKNKLHDMHHFRVDNDGNVFVLTETYNKKRDKEANKKANSFYTLTKHTPEGVEKVDLTLDGNLLTDANIILNKRNNISVIGVHSNKYALLPTGYYHIEIDGNTLETISKEFKPFSEEVTKNLKEIGSWKLSSGAWVADLRLNEDGSIFAFVEKLQTGQETDGVTVNTSTGNAKTNITYIDITSNFIVFQVDADGKLGWNKEIFSSIPEGKGGLPRQGRYHTMEYKDNQLILWETGSAYLITMIDNKGEISTKHLYSDKEANGLLAKSKAFFISEDELIIKGTIGLFEAYRFGKLNLSDFFD